MATVPTYDRFQATPNTIPQTYSHTPDLHPELVGRQAMAIGAGLSDASNVTARIGQDLIADTNRTRFDDASLQLREAARSLQFGQQTQSGRTDPNAPVGYAQLKGRDALERPDGQSLPDEYGSKLDEHVSRIAQSLGNDAQRAAFAHYAGGFTQGFKDNIWQHAFQEQRTYSASVAEGLQNEAVENLKSNYRNPMAAEEAIGTIQEQTNRIGKLKGLSDPEIAVATKKEVSAALQVGVNAYLAENDPVGAHQFYTQFAKHMTMDDALPIQAKIQKEGDNKIGLSTGQAAFVQAQPPAHAEIAFNALLPVEHNSKEPDPTYYGMRPDGTPKGSGFLGELKRPDGGVMTEYSIGVNIRGKEMDIPTIVPTLSEAEKQTLLTSKPGDKIPDSIVQKAIEHANGRLAQGKPVWANSPKLIVSPEGAVGPAQLLSSTAKEAAKLAGMEWDENRFRYDYKYNRALGLTYFQEQFKNNGNDLAKAYAAYNAGPGALQSAVKKADKGGGNWLQYLPQETQNYVPAAMANYNKAANRPQAEMTMADVEPHLATSNLTPERLKIARNEAEYQVKNYNAQIKQQGEQGLAQAIDYMSKNKVTFNQVPPEVRDGVPTDKIGSAISVGNNLLENKTNLSLYNKLAADPTKDPISGEPMSDAAFMKYRAELSESDLKHFADERAKKNGNLPGANGPGDLNSGAIKNTLDNYLNQLQIDPSPESNGGADAARVGALRKFVDEYFYASQREAGKKFTDAEVNAHLSALFAKNTTVKGFLTTSYSGPIMGMTADDLPLATRKEIKTKLKQAGIGEPTDAQIIDQYWHTQVTR